jgi:hypothetical protein
MTHKRWYDHDPMLVEVLEALRSFKEELRSQSQIFLDKITAEVGAEAVEKFYAKVLEDRGDRFGRRWYDEDPVVSKAVELLRVVPPEVQRKAAESFMSGLKAQGIPFSSKPQN